MIRANVTRILATFAAAAALALMGTATSVIAAPTGSGASYVMASPLSVGVQTGTDYTMVSCPLVIVELKIEPKSLNLKSKEKYVTAYIKVPSGFLASQINVSSILLNNSVPVTNQYAPKITDHDTKLKVKFLRSLVVPTLVPGKNVPVTVTGDIAGMCFGGTDYIKVSAPHVHHPDAADLPAAGTTTQVVWDADPTYAATVKFEASLDAGNSWVTQAQELPNTGSYAWHIPSTYVSNNALIRMLIVYEVDEQGEVPEIETANSEVFEITGSTTGVGGSQAEFALRGTSPSPAVGQMRISFSLKDTKPATLALFDLGGRLIDEQRVDQLGPGAHVVTLGQRSNLSAGVYLIRLTQDGRSISGRATFVR